MKRIELQRRLPPGWVLLGLWWCVLGLTTFLAYRYYVDWFVDDKVLQDSEGWGSGSAWLAFWGGLIGFWWGIPMTIVAVVCGFSKKWDGRVLQAISLVLLLVAIPLFFGWVSWSN